MHITAFGGGRQHGAARFGLITVLSPTVRQAVEAELRSANNQTVIAGISRLVSDPQITRPNLLGPWDASGVWPHIDHDAEGGVFPLPDGRGLIATNEPGHKRRLIECSRPDTPNNGDDMNHLIRMLKDRRGQSSEAVAAAYLDSEQALASAGAKPSVRQVNVVV